MNREMWLRILTVAVLAPYLFKQSQKETGYFGVGLKLLAGGLIALNIPPLMEDAKVLQAQAKTFMQQVAAAQKTLNANARIPVTIDAEDAEFTESV